MTDPRDFRDFHDFHDLHDFLTATRASLASFKNGNDAKHRVGTKTKSPKSWKSLAPAGHNVQ